MRTSTAASSESTVLHHTADDAVASAPVLSCCFVHRVTPVLKVPNVRRGGGDSVRRNCCQPRSSRRSSQRARACSLLPHVVARTPKFSNGGCGSRQARGNGCEGHRQRAIKWPIVQEKQNPLSARNKKPAFSLRHFELDFKKMKALMTLLQGGDHGSPPATCGSFISHISDITHKHSSPSRSVHFMATI